MKLNREFYKSVGKPHEVMFLSCYEKIID